MHAALFAVALFAAGADPAPERLTADNLVDHLAQHADTVADRLAAARRGAVRRNAPKNVTYFEKSGRYLFRSIADRDAEVQRLQQQVDSPTLPLLWIVPAGSPHRPVDGQIGSLAQRHTTYQVVQVVDESNAIIAGEARALGSPNRYEWTFWLRSPIVKNLRDDQSLASLPGAYRLNGTKSYTTVLGARRTIELVESFDLAPYQEKADAAR